MKDIVFINPSSKEYTYQNLSNNLTAIETPIWTGMLSQFCRDNGLDIDIIDVNAENISPIEAAKRLQKLNPKLVVIVVYGHNPNASTQLMPNTREICSAIKSSNQEQKILLTGGHIASLPQQTLAEESIDYVCDGEGFYTILDLVKNDFKNIHNINGLVYRDSNNNIITNNPSPLLHYVPEVSWDLLPMNKYRAHNWHCLSDIENRQPYASIYTTLGCPFNCFFCCIQAPFKRGELANGLKHNSYRMQDPEVTLRQIDELVNKYHVKNIKIADELFVMNKKHVLSICNGIIDRGYDLNIWAYARVDSITPDLLPILKKAGINWLGIGFESGNEDVRKSANKQIDMNKICDITKQIKNHGINIMGNFVFGLPEDTPETMQQTLNLAIELNCEFVNLCSAMAYPGSQLYQYAIDNNWALPSTWNGYSQHSIDCLPLPTKHISGKEVLKFRDQAWISYFTRQEYIEMIYNKFGQDAVNHIQELTKITIKR